MNIDTEMAVTYDAPYPKIMVLRPNRDYVNMLMPGINSCTSEMTAITTYLYQHWNLNQNYQEMAEVIFRIAKVEMTHMDMLGKMVVKLGGCPGFAENNCSFWNGLAVDYSLDIETALKNNIASEEGAVNFYMKNAMMIRDPHIKNLLERIAKDERVHIGIFKQFLACL